MVQTGIRIASFKIDGSSFPNLGTGTIPPGVGSGLVWNQRTAWPIRFQFWTNSVPVRAKLWSGLFKCITI